MAHLFRSEDIQDAFRDHQPTGWHAGYGFVYLAKSAADGRDMLLSLKQWADREGFPVRIPHYSVSMKGINGELDRAMGGILILDELTEFDTRQLAELGRRIRVEDIPVVLVGIVDPDDRGALDVQEARSHAREIAESIVMLSRSDIEGGPVPPTAPVDDVAQALAAINRHRATIGMSRLDPVAADWTEEDILIEAERIQRLPNPFFDPRWRLLR